LIVITAFYLKTAEILITIKHVVVYIIFHFVYISSPELL